MKKYGIKEEVELEEARGYKPTPREVKDYLKWAKTQQKGIGPRPVLDIEDVNQWTHEIYKGIKAGWKSVSKSTLGGDENVAIMIKVTVEPERDWPHKILQNASYGMIRISTDCTMEIFASGHKIKNMRKTKIKTPRDIVSKINTWIKKVDEEVLEDGTDAMANRYKKDTPGQIEEVEDEAYGGTEKRLKAKKKTDKMGIFHKKDKSSGYVEATVDELSKGLLQRASQSAKKKAGQQRAVSDRAASRVGDPNYPPGQNLKSKRANYQAAKKDYQAFKFDKAANKKKED